jgi:hypothetical protein
LAARKLKGTRQKQKAKFISFKLSAGTFAVPPGIELEKMDEAASSWRQRSGVGRQ